MIAIAVVVAALLVTPAVIERVSYERQGGRWIDEQGRFEATDGVGYEALVERARDMGPGRIFSEQRGPSVSRYRIGQVPTFAALLNLQADAIGFTRPTWSLMSPAEYRFDIGDPDMRELFGVRYVIWPEDRQLPAAQRIAQVGRHVLWEFPDTGYLDVVDTIAPVAADRENIGQQTSSILRSGCSSIASCPPSPSGDARRRNRRSVPNEQPTEASGHGRERDGRTPRRHVRRLGRDGSAGGRDLQGVLRPTMGGHGRRRTRRTADACRLRWWVYPCLRASTRSPSPIRRIHGRDRCSSSAR